jgi:hypothetical protein
MVAPSKPPAATDALVGALGQLLGDVIVVALRRPDVAAAIQTLTAATPAAATAATADLPGGLLSKAALAKRLDVSIATVDRLTREGLPVAAHVGDGRRYDLAACRAWLATRGKRPTKAPKRDTVDIADVVDGSGLVRR